MTRKEARALGLKRYHGVVCPYGHSGERYTSTGNCCACLLVSASNWKDDNHERTREYAKERYWKNPTAHNAKTREWFARNPERARELRLAWHAANPFSRRLHEEKRRSLKKSAAGILTVVDINQVASKQRYRCIYCNISIRKMFNIDHIMPLALGGTHDISNIQLLCPSCNHRKHSKHPLAFARQIGRLL